MAHVVHHSVAESRFGTQDQVVVGDIEEGVVEHLFRVDYGADLQPVDGALTRVAHCIGIDISRKFYLYGTSHFVLTRSQHEVNDLGEGEDTMIEHVGKRDYFTALTEVGVAQNTVVDVESGDEITKRSRSSGIIDVDLADIKGVVGSQFGLVVGLREGVELGLSVAWP